MHFLQVSIIVIELIESWKLYHIERCFNIICAKNNFTVLIKRNWQK